MHALNGFLAAAGITALLAAGILARTAPDPASRAAAATSARVALVPLDDRAPSLGDPVLLGAVADTEVATPPATAIGKHLRTGAGDVVARWLDQLDLTTLDAVVIAADMVAYGGLIGSRVPRVTEADALRRIEAIARLKQRRPDLPVYVFASIMRLAPTDDGSNPRWRGLLAQWAALPAREADSPAAAEIARALPAGMIDRYRANRARNLAVSLALVDLAARSAIDRLVFGQDDPRPEGVHLADRDAIDAAIARAGVKPTATIQPGTDDLATVLLARAITSRFNYHPAVHVRIAPDAARTSAVPSDGRTLAEVVAAQVTGAGARVAARAGPGSLELFVHASRGNTAAGAFAAEVGRRVAAGARAAVADIDPAGTTDGASVPLVEALRGERLLPRLYGFAASRSAGAGAGGAAAQAVLFALSVDTLAPGRPEVGGRVARAQVRFLLRRLVHDFLYQGVVRVQATEEMVSSRGIDPLRLDDRQRARLEQYVADELRPLAEGLVGDFAGAPWRLPSARRAAAVSIQVRDIEAFQVGLPWGSLAEPDISFAVAAPDSSAGPRPPRPRLLR